MKRKAGKRELKITYKQDEGVSEEESQRCLDKAFDILFAEVEKRLQTEKSKQKE